MKKFIEESWLVLVMGVVFALLLAGTQTTLSERIRENQKRALSEAIADVVPNTADTEELEIDGNRLFKCLDKDKNLIGWAVQASGTGFVDKITLVVGLTLAADEITGLKVIENLETPGLGNKIVGPWADRYKGLSTDADITVRKGRADHDKNQIDAITGATWSSRYVTDIVNDCVQRIRPELDVHR